MTLSLFLECLLSHTPRCSDLPPTVVVAGTSRNKNMQSFSGHALITSDMRRHHSSGVSLYDRHSDTNTPPQTYTPSFSKTAKVSKGIWFRRNHGGGHRVR